MSFHEVFEFARSMHPVDLRMEDSLVAAGVHFSAPILYCEQCRANRAYVGYERVDNLKPELAGSVLIFA